MSNIIDKMLDLTADIAEELLLVKDAERDTLPDGLKLKIINLAELASQTAPLVEASSLEEDVEASETEAEKDPEAEVEAAETEAEEAVVEDSEVPEQQVELEIADNAEFEEVADADEEETEAAEEEAEVAEEEAGATEEVPDSVEEEAEAAEVVSAEFEEVADADEDVPEVAEDVSAEFEEAPDADEDNAETKEEITEIPPTKHRIEVGGLRKSLSINDLFLFKRELAGGSNDRFNAILEEISTLPDNRRSLQEYLVERMGLNLNESPGKDFYESLLKFF